MRRFSRAGNLGWMLVSSVLGILMGCSSPSKTGSNLMPGCHGLIHDASCVRKQTPVPDAIPRELRKQVADPYILEPGDVLLVQPINLESPLRLGGDQVVLQDGTIPLGRLGRMQVAGKTIEQIEAEINAKVRALGLENSQVSARLVSRDSKVFYVLGEVNAPGTFPLRGRETVLDALLCAGGLSTNASRCQIILTRPTSPCSCRIVLPVDYNGIVQLGDTTTNYQIRAGDRIFVPSKSLWTDLHALFHPQRNPPVGCCEIHDAIRTTYFAPIYHTSGAEVGPVAPALPANIPAPHPFEGSPGPPISDHPGQPASAVQPLSPPSRKDG